MTYNTKSELDLWSVDLWSVDLCSVDLCSVLIYDPHGWLSIQYQSISYRRHYHWQPHRSLTLHGWIQYTYNIYGCRLFALFHVMPCGFTIFVQFSLIQVGIYKCLGKRNMRFNPCLKSLPKIAVETVPIFAWLATALSRPFKVSSTADFFFLFPSLLQTIDGVMFLAPRLQAMPEAPYVSEEEGGGRSNIVKC